jgi:NAD-dependent SIR2 family protein deacetylase
MSSPSSEPQYSFATEEEINSFGKHLYKSKRILALCGAGLSAASGIPTFRGSGALWRGHKAAHLSSIEAFEANPGLVWKYMMDGRHLALQAKPNAGHEALAKLAKKKKKGFVCLTQNIDGLFVGPMSCLQFIAGLT